MKEELKEDYKMRRIDDFNIRRKHLDKLSDEEIKERFWKLTEQIVQPLIDLAYYNTSPSIERSVLLRMGFSSIEAKEIVNRAMKFDLLGKGVGHIVLRYAEIIGKTYINAGLILSKDEGWDKVIKSFEE